MTWLDNVVMVKKLNENGKFVKFTNLNKTCPRTTPIV